MTVPAVRVSTDLAHSIATDVLVIGVGSSDDGPILRADAETFLELASNLAAIGMTGGKDELVRVPLSVGSARSVALVGLGSGQPDAHALRYAAGTAARRLTGVDSIVFDLPTTTDDELYAVLEGAAIGAYCYTEYRNASLESTKR